MKPRSSLCNYRWERYDGRVIHEIDDGDVEIYRVCCGALNALKQTDRHGWSTIIRRHWWQSHRISPAHITPLSLSLSILSRNESLVQCTVHIIIEHMEYKNNEIRFLNHPPAAAPFSIDHFSLWLTIIFGCLFAVREWWSIESVELWCEFEWDEFQINLSLDCDCDCENFRGCVFCTLVETTVSHIHRRLDSTLHWTPLYSLVMDLFVLPTGYGGYFLTALNSLLFFFLFQWFFEFQKKVLVQY